MNTTGCLISKLPPMDKREGRAKHGTGGRQPWERLRWKVSHDVSVAVLPVVPRSSSSFLEETTVLFHLESSKNHLDDFSGEFSQVIMSFFLILMRENHGTSQSLEAPDCYENHSEHTSAAEPLRFRLTSTMAPKKLSCRAAQGCRTNSS